MRIHEQQRQWNNGKPEKNNERSNVRLEMGNKRPEREKEIKNEGGREKG